MTWCRVGSCYLLRLERGEDIPATLTRFVEEQRIRSGIVTGIGAASAIELGYFHLARRRYHRRTIRAECELAALTGNIAWLDRKPVCHLHAVVSDRQLRAWGGHLFAARTAATCEIWILPGRAQVGRAPDPLTGLNLLSLPARRRRRPA